MSGNPCPRLIAPVSTASADISAKMVVPKDRIRSTSGSGSKTGEEGARDMVVTLE